LVTLGIDAHKRTDTVVAVDRQGRQVAARMITAHARDHLGRLGRRTRGRDGLLWAIEDCRHLSRRLDQDLLAAG
jgi:transposase